MKRILEARNDACWPVHFTVGGTEALNDTQLPFLLASIFPVIYSGILDRWFQVKRPSCSPQGMSTANNPIMSGLGTQDQEG